MASTYSLKLIGKNNKIIDRQSVKLAAGKFVGPVVVKAQPDVMYHLSAENNAQALEKITAKKVGNDLHVAFLDSDIKSPDLVIQGYFEFNATVNLATSNLAGELVEFSSNSGFLSSSLTGPAAATDAAVATTLSAPGVVTSWYSNPLAQLAMIGGGVAVLASAKKSSSDTPASTDATKGIGKVLAYRGDANKKPSISDYSEGGVTGVTSDNVEAVNTAVAASAADTKDKVQNIVTVYAKILAKANGTAADTTTDDPTVADYKVLGMELLGAAVNTKQLTLLNEIIKTRTRTEVDDVKELNALASTVNKIFINASTGQGTTTDITGTEFKNIGIYDTSPGTTYEQALDANKTTSIQAKALADAIRRRGAGNSDTLDAIKTINTAYLKILAAADGTKANATDVPKLADFQAIGADKGTTKGKALTSGDPQQVDALKLLTTSIDGLTATQVNTLTQIDNINKTIDKVMAIAIASNTDAATVITAQGLTATDLGLLGITGATKDNVKFIASAIQAAANTAATPDTTKVDELKELQGLVDVGVVMAYADTSTTYASTEARRIPAHTAPTTTNLTSAGVVALDEGLNKAIKNLPAIQSAINALADPDKVNTKDELQTIVNTYDKLLTMADYVPNVSDKTNFTEVGKRMTQADYRAIGALNYSALPSTSLGTAATTLEPSKFNTDNVSKAAKASATAATTSTPTVNDSALNLLNNVVDNLATTSVDSIEEINALSLSIDKIFAVADGDANLGTSVGAGATPLSASDLTALGLNSINPNNAAYLKLVAKGLNAAVKAPATGGDLATTADYTKLDTLLELQSAVDLGVVMAYAETSPNITPLPTTSHTTPTLLNYTSLGVVKTDTTLNKAISDVDAINSAVEALGRNDSGQVPSAKVDTLFEIQNIVNIYNRVLKMADGSRIVGGGITPAYTAATSGSAASGKLTVQEYKDIGALSYDVDGLYTATSVSRVAGAGGTQTSALNLLNDLIDGLNTFNVNSIKEINDLSRLVDKVMDTADGSGITKSLTLLDLSTLGVTNIPSSTDTGFLTKLETNIIGSDDNGSQVDTVQELQAWATLATAQRYAQLNGDSSAGAVAPNTTSYQNLEDSGIISGFTGVDWTNALATAVNSALLPLDANLSGVGLRDISISFQNILNEAQNREFDQTLTTNPTATDYVNIGVIGFGSEDAAALNLMNDIVRNKSQSAVGDLNTIKNFATLITKIEALVDQNASGTWSSSTTINTDLTLPNFTSLGLAMTNSSGTTLTTNQFNSFLFQIAKATDHASFDTLSEFRQLLNTQAVLNV